MSNIAVIKLAGAQHLVRAGDKFEVNKLDFEVQKDMSADVLMSTNGDKLLLKEGDVKIKVLENKKGDKLRIVKFKAKSRYRRAQGHRQHLSLVEILSINGESKAKKTVDIVNEEPKPSTNANKSEIKKIVKSIKKGENK